ncbi:MAG: helix-turn-helix domain-containing protein [Oscillospiraceae bacterium]|nr:helix-turn-helix domain-containing protein [Oscillospiraceae bacterium]MBQ7130624.1 helix-turn-helix domain-containing protein [Oscillospiraceae bacterium]
MPAKTQRFETRQHMKNNTFEIFRYRDDYPKEVALHHHDFYEIYFFLSGNVQYNVESRSYLLTPGDVLLISPMELHQPMFGSEHRSYERIVLWIDKRFLDGFSIPGQDFTQCFDTSAPGHTNLLRPEGVARQFLTFLLEQLISEYTSDDQYQEIASMTYLAQVLISLNRLARQKKSEEDSVRAPDSSVYNVLGYINDHYSEDLSLDYLANKFFISKYHLSREFQRLVGTSVHRYIIQKRLVMAKQMLSEGRPSSEVYQHCGFGDYSNFYRAFKAEYQISPKDYVLLLKESAYRADPLPHRIRERMAKE